ncbi:MAG: hypothetical protein ABR562_02665 [Thermoplasmatota archaeon]|nr:hypothetical protein [Halobacteriales archaeon]
MAAVVDQALATFHRTTWTERGVDYSSTDTMEAPLPFTLRVPALQSEMAGDAEWYFSYSWAQLQWEVTNSTGLVVSMVYMRSNGQTEVQAFPGNEATFRESLGRTFAAHGTPAPTFTHLIYTEEDCICRGPCM